MKTQTLVSLLTGGIHINSILGYFEAIFVGQWAGSGEILGNLQHCSANSSQTQSSARTWEEWMPAASLFISLTPWHPFRPCFSSSPCYIVHVSRHLRLQTEVRGVGFCLQCLEVLSGCMKERKFATMFTVAGRSLIPTMGATQQF